MKIDHNIWGLVLVMDHADVQAFVGAAPKITAAAGAATPLIVAGLVGAGVAAGLAGAIAAAIVAAIGLNIALIVAVDTGSGAYVTVPWPAVFSLAPVLIPTTAPPTTLPPSATWASASSGVFGTDDPADRISYEIEPNAVLPATGLVLFRFVLGTKSSGWWKNLTIPPGIIIHITGVGSVANGGAPIQLLAGPGAQIVFTKAGFLNTPKQVYSLGGLNLIKAGDRTTFTWETD
jgi:hypothetical protein